MTSPASFLNYLGERLSGSPVNAERFQALAARLLATGMLWRGWSTPEQRMYDDALQVEQVLREAFALFGFVLTHDTDAQIFRLYAPGATDAPGDETGTASRLRARLSMEFVACALALRFLYTEALTGKREMGAREEAAVTLEELSAACATLLNHQLPRAQGERLALLRELRKHRLIRFNDNEQAGSMDTVLSIVRPVMSFVSDEVLNDALRQAQAARTTQAPSAQQTQAAQ